MQPTICEIVICIYRPWPDKRSVNFAKCFVTHLSRGGFNHSWHVCLIPKPGTRNPPKLSFCVVVLPHIKSSSFLLESMVVSLRKERAFRKKEGMPAADISSGLWLQSRSWVSAVLNRTHLIISIFAALVVSLQMVTQLCTQALGKCFL